MENEDAGSKEIGRLRAVAMRALLRIEILALVLLAVLLSATAFAGMGGAAVSLWEMIRSHGAPDLLVIVIDRLLFVLMVVEILHTVRDTFRSGSLVPEPFLIVGLIASIRRVLVITLESSRYNVPGGWTPKAQTILDSTMLELAVLSALILIMVISIYLLRRSDRLAALSSASVGHENSSASAGHGKQNASRDDDERRSDTV